MKLFIVLSSSTLGDVGMTGAGSWWGRGWGWGWTPDDTLELPEGGDWAVLRGVGPCIVMGVASITEPQSTQHEVGLRCTRTNKYDTSGYDLV